MHCPLTLSTSAEVDRVLLFHFLALVSFIPLEKCIFLSPPLGTSTLYEPSFVMQVLLVLTNQVRLSVRCILAIFISYAASHWCWGLLAQCRAA